MTLLVIETVNAAIFRVYDHAQNGIFQRRAIRFQIARDYTRAGNRVQHGISHRGNILRLQ